MRTSSILVIASSICLSTFFLACDGVAPRGGDVGPRPSPPSPTEDAGVVTYDDTGFGTDDAGEKTCDIVETYDTDEGYCVDLECTDGSTPTRCAEDGQDAQPCSVEDTDEGARVTCPDGSSAVVKDGESCSVQEEGDCARIFCTNGSSSHVCDGEDGQRGPQGSDGADGTDCNVEDVDDGAIVNCGDSAVLVRDGEDAQPCSTQEVEEGIRVSCPDGSSAVVEDGERGPQGPKGEDGNSCTVRRVHSCAFVFCEDGTSSRVCEGADGEDAVAGTSCSIEEAQSGSIIVCGDGSSVFVVQNNSDGDSQNGSDAGMAADIGHDASQDTSIMDTGVDTGTDIGTDTGTSDTGTDTGTGTNIRFSGSDNSVVEVDPSGLALNDGTPLGQVSNLVVVHWAPGESFNASENGISDVDNDGWIEIPLPRIKQGDQPYSISCSADSDIPYRFQLARANPSQVGDWLDLSGKQSVFGQFFWSGIDDSCVCTFSLSVSWNGSSYYTTSNSNFSCTP